MTLASGLAAASALLPLLVAGGILIDGASPARHIERARELAARLGLMTPAVTPSGRPPREGPWSHPAIDRRHSPRLPVETHSE